MNLLEKCCNSVKLMWIWRHALIPMFALFFVLHFFSSWEADSRGEIVAPLKEMAKLHMIISGPGFIQGESACQDCLQHLKLHRKNYLSFRLLLPQCPQTHGAICGAVICRERSLTQWSLWDILWFSDPCQISRLAGLIWADTSLHLAAVFHHPKPVKSFPASSFVLYTHQLKSASGKTCLPFFLSTFGFLAVLPKTWKQMLKWLESLYVTSSGPPWFPTYVWQTQNDSWQTEKIGWKGLTDNYFDLKVVSDRCSLRTLEVDLPFKCYRSGIWGSSSSPFLYQRTSNEVCKCLTHSSISSSKAFFGLFFCYPTPVWSNSSDFFHILCLCSASCQGALTNLLFVFPWSLPAGRS